MAVEFFIERGWNGLRERRPLRILFSSKPATCRSFHFLCLPDAGAFSRTMKFATSAEVLWPHTREAGVFHEQRDFVRCHAVHRLQAL